MLTFVRNEKGKAEAQEGKHDDLILGLAIAHYARGQEIDNPPAEKIALPETLPPDLRRDLEADPAALAHWLSQHKKYN
jgi:phage terminase large subunit